MSDYTAAQFAELKHLLVSRQGALREEIHEQLTRAGADAAGLLNQIATLADDALAAYESDYDLAMLSRDIVELRDIEAALDRMRQSLYGQCVDCSEPIRYARLRAFPTAKRCIACQTARERMQGRPASL
jgi:RNA polymerase-binding transcription factor DksA